MLLTTGSHGGGGNKLCHSFLDQTRERLEHDFGVQHVFAIQFQSRTQLKSEHKLTDGVLKQ